jgi:hypothetical protein
VWAPGSGRIGGGRRGGCVDLGEVVGEAGASGPGPHGKTATNG